jgi:hypothetical protein|tara:strand:- start:5834 stop:6037 length:204 start_codon:yes stop_codon:yes gene_type:complete
LEIHKSLEAGWIDLTAVSAVAYADVVHMISARSEYVSKLRTMLEAEELAAQRPAGWAESQLREMIHA